MTLNGVIFHFFLGQTVSQAVSQAVSSISSCCTSIQLQNLQLGFAASLRLSLAQPDDQSGIMRCCQRSSRKQHTLGTV